MSLTTNVSTTWDDFIPVNQLNIANNCDLYGNWLSLLWQPDNWNKSLESGMSVPTTLDYLYDMMPKSFFTREDVVAMDVARMDANLIGWFFDLQISHDERWFAWTATPGMYQPTDVFQAVFIRGPREKCGAEFCKAMGYTSNNDLAGIGVMVSYYMEAILATLYLVAFTVKQAKTTVARRASSRQGPGPDPGPKPEKMPGRASTFAQAATSRVMDAFRGSLDSFLASAMLMSTAFLLASIWTIGNKISDKNDPDEEVVFGSALYDIIFAVLASAFSVFPVMVIYALMRHPEAGQEGAHRKWLRRVMLGLTWVLAVVVVYIAPRGEMGYEDRHNESVYFYCDHRGGFSYWHGLKASQFLVIGVPLLWILLTTFVLTGFRIPGLVSKPWVRRWRESWRLTVAWLNLLIGWGILAYFTVLRRQIRNTAGGMDKDTGQWGFGQVVAVATWVPVICEWLYICAFGIIEGLSGHLPFEYIVSLRHPNEPAHYGRAFDGSDGDGSGGAGGAMPLNSDYKTPFLDQHGVTPSPPGLTPDSVPPLSSVYVPPAAPPSSYFLPIIVPPEQDVAAASGNEQGPTTTSPPLGQGLYDPHISNQQQQQQQPVMYGYDPNAAPTQQQQQQQVPMAMVYDPNAPIQQQQQQPLVTGYDASATMQQQPQGTVVYDPGVAQPQMQQVVTSYDPGAIQQQPQQHHHHHPHLPAVFHVHDAQQQQQQHQQQNQAYQQWHNTAW